MHWQVQLFKRPHTLAGAAHFSSAYFGQGSGPIFMDNVECGNDDTVLLACSYDPNTSEDSHGEDAGIRCKGECFIAIHTCTGCISNVSFVIHFVGSSFLH